MKSVTALTEEEVAGLLVIAVVAAMMGWFLVEPVGGTSRTATAVVSGLIALAVGVPVYLVLN